MDITITTTSGTSV